MALLKCLNQQTSGEGYKHMFPSALGMETSSLGKRQAERRLPIRQHWAAGRAVPRPPGWAPAAPPQLLAAPTVPYRARRGRVLPSPESSRPPNHCGAPSVWVGIYFLPPLFSCWRCRVNGRWRPSRCPQAPALRGPRRGSTTRRHSGEFPRRSLCRAVPIGRAAGRERREAERELPAADKQPFVRPSSSSSSLPTLCTAEGTRQRDKQTDPELSFTHPPPPALSPSAASLPMS
ncbi:uncharacterized protein LOC131378526 [Hirundo rustica]|uniref:uncharacterized protein LOC131378526 n=1 Tax=Hirundo rustica TaxID=43150 RepID=UPI002673629F|nr:uncharacterized protein LOC131378526 [Hirundo rustica]